MRLTTDQMRALRLLDEAGPRGCTETFVAFRLVWHLIMSSKLRRPTGAKRARYFAASAARTASAGDWTSP